MTSFRSVVLLSILLLLNCISGAQQFSFTKPVTILYSTDGPKLDSISACLLAADIKNVTGTQPGIITSLQQANGNLIVLGNVESNLIQKFVTKRSWFYNRLRGKWECFGLKVFDKPAPNISKALVIAGSDIRGTAYGAFTLSEKIGVSPWYWWADVPVKQQKNLIISQKEYVSSTPSVKYRGIFINDEDWGLQPWAAKTFEPETGDIGPKTYAKVFELLLRLKANLIWPAMHPSTKAFFHYPLNKQVAEDYSIIIGSSHAEPMLRNNVSEWDEKTMGHFNYLTNKEKVDKYWEDRVKEVGKQEVMFSLGMRGVHDSQMEGVKDAKEAVPVLERIFQDQRDLLKKYQQKDISQIPQIFTAYKEVLDIYDNGLKLPDNVTIVWPDDNYGYIQRLNNEAEKKRPGGSGVYYHASYWGRPHDYLWLSSTHPSLVSEEMMKAYQNGSNRLWVLNVGDIKPLEYNIQLFLDMAYNANPFSEGDYTKKHLYQWYRNIFGEADAKEITDIFWNYYNLAFERRPEFMGWSQTEPTTKTTYTGYNHFSYGDEAQRRINRYDSLETAVRILRQRFTGKNKNAFYQLVYYPVAVASWMNKKFLYRDKAYVYSKQNRIGAFDYAAQSMSAYDSIVKETKFYNEQLSDGKWKGIMSMMPRQLPVYLSPELPKLSIQKTELWNVVPEGYDTTAYINNTEKKLPTFIKGLNQSNFVDIYLSDSIALNWKAKPSGDWIKLSSLDGTLFPKQNQNSVRLWVSVDWTKVPASIHSNGFIEFSADGKKISIGVNVLQPKNNDYAKFKGFVEQNGVISIYASDYTGKVDKPKIKWELKQSPGQINISLQSTVSINSLDEKPDTNAISKNSAYVTYTFYSFSHDVPRLSVCTLPAHPLNTNFGMRYAVSVDDGPARIVNFQTFGRSEEWKQNVLRNAAIREITFPQLQSGPHTIKIYTIDPGVVLDRLIIRFGDVATNYSVIPETRKN